MHNFKTNLASFLDFLEGKQIVIYGWGRLGQMFYSLLTQYGLQIIEIWDKGAGFINFSPKNVPLLKLDHSSLLANDKTVVLVTIMNNRISEMIADEIEKKGFIVIAGRNTLLKVIEENCEKKYLQRHTQETFNCRICPNNVVHMHKICKIRDMILNASQPTHGKLTIALGLVVTTRCTLKCKGCVQLINFAKNKEYVKISLSKMIKNIVKIADSVDEITTLSLTGGEVFLFKELYTLIKRLLAIRKVLMIQIVTNGTINKIGQDVIDLLKLHSGKINLILSNYANLPRQLKLNYRLFKELLTNSDIPFYENSPTITWYDTGNFSKRTESNADLKRKIEACEFARCCGLINNDLFGCTRAKHAMLLEKIPNSQTDYLTLDNYSSNESLRLAIEKFYQKQQYNSCLFCDGQSGVLIPSGRQS